MSSSLCEDLGKLILRLSLGILILLHGFAKLDGGVQWLVGSLSAHGLPGFVAYGVYVGEVIAPLLIIFGLFARLGGIIIAINMLFAFFLVHTADFFNLGNSGGWALELQGMYFFTSIAVVLLGAGAYSLGGKHGKWN